MRKEDSADTWSQLQYGAGVVRKPHVGQYRPTPEVRCTDAVQIVLHGIQGNPLFNRLIVYVCLCLSVGLSPTLVAWHSS